VQRRVHGDYGRTVEALWNARREAAYCGRIST
jgi:hypothetical protein